MGTHGDLLRSMGTYGDPWAPTRSDTTYADQWRLIGTYEDREGRMGTFWKL